MTRGQKTIAQPMITICHDDKNNCTVTMTTRAKHDEHTTTERHEQPHEQDNNNKMAMRATKTITQ
jgi:hypothetical protein